MEDIVKVFAPASVANLSCGFDILGLAIISPGDIIVAKRNDKSNRLTITSITGDNGKLPKEISKNTAGFAAYKLLESLDKADTGIDLEIHKRMPFGSGLGSSAASAAGAVFAISELLDLNLPKTELLPFAALGEQRADGAYHLDNVAPSLLGGITLIRDNATADVIKLPIPDNVYINVIHPDIKILTEDARKVLSDSVPLKAHILQTGNVAAFVSALYNQDYALLSRSMTDHIIEEQRQQLIPGFKLLKEKLLDIGVISVGISGSGPSIFCMSNGKNQAAMVHKLMSHFYQALNIDSQVYTSKINKSGVIRI